MQDEGTKITDNTRLPSYLKMQDFVAKDKKVRILLTKERQGQADDDFADIEAEEAGDSAVSENADKWMAELDFDKKGSIKSTASNIIAILENDPRLKNHIWQNLFNGFNYITGGLPERRGDTMGQY